MVPGICKEGKTGGDAEKRQIMLEGFKMQVRIHSHDERMLWHHCANKLFSTSLCFTPSGLT